MTTVFFNLVTLPYTTSNPIQVRLYKTSSPNAQVAMQEKPAPHPQTTWSFPGLDRDAYIVRIYDMASPIAVQLGQDFTVIPDNNEVRYHDPFWIEFDVTLNPSTGLVFASGTNTFTVADWIGWDIIFDRKGADTQDGSDILWDKTTGTATLQQPSDIFQSHEKWFLLFMPLIQESSLTNTGTFGRLWSGRLVVTNNITLTADDIGKKILIKGAVNYLEITLPDLSLVAEDVVTWFESGRTAHLCVKIICNGANNIDYLTAARSSIFIIPNESFELYKEVDSGSRWRLQNVCGQFSSVGRFVSDYGGQIFNSVPADGALLSVKSYARLYFEYIKNLGGSQVCAYADWSSGNNKYKFSLANNETTGNFRVPDLRNLFERSASATIAAAVWEDFQMQDHIHYVPLGTLPSPPYGSPDPVPVLSGQYNGTSLHSNDRTSQAKSTGTGVNANIGSETRPINFRAVKRILL